MTDSDQRSPAPDYSDDNAVIDADEDRWAWRRKIKSTPAGAKTYRIAVFVVGLVVTVGGLAMVPLPGPGWLVVIAGLAIWASEFEQAQAVLDFVKKQVRAWERWLSRQNPAVKVLVILVTALFVAAVMWCVFKVMGVPTWLPDSIESFMHDTLKL